MTQPIDPRDLAALLEGRVQGRERDDLLARIAASDEEYDVFADAATLLREMEEEDAAAAAAPPAGTPLPVTARSEPATTEAAPAGVTPIASHPRWRSPGWAVVLAIAAVLAAMALVPLRRAWTAERAWRDPERLALEVGERKGAFADPAWDRQSWDTHRGGSSAVADRGRSARLGAKLVDLALAVQTRDRKATARIAAAVESLLADIPAAGAVRQEVARIRTQAGAPAGSLAPLLHRAQDDARRLAGADDAFALGAWTEAARLASLRENAAFFRSAASRRALDRAAQSPLLDDAARAAAGRVGAATERGEVRDWTAVRADLSMVQRALAG